MRRSEIVRSGRLAVLAITPPVLQLSTQRLTRSAAVGALLAAMLWATASPAAAAFNCSGVNPTAMSAGAHANVARDCETLLALRTIISSASGTTSFLNWSPSSAMTGWTGVTVDTAKGVTALNLRPTSSNRLLGTLPAAIGSLSELTTLDLGNNRMTGSLPTQLGSLTKLTSLDISNNRMSGSLPTQLGSLTALTSLNLSSKPQQQQLLHRRHPQRTRQPHRPHHPEPQQQPAEQRHPQRTRQPHRPHHPEPQQQPAERRHPQGTRQPHRPHRPPAAKKP